MRIAGNKPHPMGLPPSASERSERSGKARGAEALGTDTVKLSNKPAELQRVLAADDAARTARIAEVKAQIESGGYPLDFGRLAESIVDDEVGRWTT